MLVRSDGEAMVVNLDIDPVETPQTVAWVDPETNSQAAVGTGTTLLFTTLIRFAEACVKLTGPLLDMMVLPRLRSTAEPQVAVLAIDV